jgi:hypothetical protein
MIRFFPNELWKEVEIPCTSLQKYAVTNFGRIISYNDKVEDGKIIKGATSLEYRAIKTKLRIKKKKFKHFSYYVHKLVAELFIPKPSKDHKMVIHLDFNKSNNHYLNLKWATTREVYEHSRVSYANNKTAEKPKPIRDGHKLTVSNVILIKKKLADPNRKTRLKMIAKQFGISEMQLYRIKTGENWGHIKLEI